MRQPENMIGKTVYLRFGTKIVKGTIFNILPRGDHKVLIIDYLGTNWNGKVETLHHYKLLGDPNMAFHRHLLEGKITPKAKKSRKKAIKKIKL